MGMENPVHAPMGLACASFRRLPFRPGKYVTHQAPHAALIPGPWWLCRVGRQEDAKNSIRRTAVKGYYTEQLLNAQVALIDHTHELEWQETKKGSLFNCFKGTNRRRLEIVCVVWSVQYWCGQPMTGYSTYLYVPSFSETDLD